MHGREKRKGIRVIARVHWEGRLQQERRLTTRVFSRDSRQAHKGI